MNKELEKILRQSERNPYMVSERLTWKRFWQEKQKLFNRYTYWRFVLAAPLYLVIYIGQALIRPEHWRLMQQSYLPTPAIIKTDFTFKGESGGIAKWIKSLTEQERKDLQQLFDDNELGRAESIRKVHEDLAKAAPRKTVFYQDGSLPVKLEDVKIITRQEAIKFLDSLKESKKQD